MEKTKKAPGRLAPYYQQIIDPGYQTGTSVFLLAKTEDPDKMDTALKTAKAIYLIGGIKALKEKFSQLKMPAVLSFEKQDIKTKEQEPLIPFVLGKPRNGRDLQIHEYSWCGSTNYLPKAVPILQVI